MHIIFDFIYFLFFSDDSWDDRDAQVVCRMLGFSRNGATAVLYSTYGSVVDNFIMDDVNCDGTEDSLEDCSYSPTDNCSEREGAGVICTDTASIQLIGGQTSKYSSEGNVLSGGRPIW